MKPDMTNAPRYLTEAEITDLQADLKHGLKWPAIPETVSELIAAVEQIFDCEQGEFYGYTRHPPRMHQHHQDDLPEDAKHWYATFMSPSVSSLWIDFARAYELTGGRRRVAKPKLYWRLADKIQQSSGRIRTRIAIPDLSFSPQRDTWLRAATHKPEGEQFSTAEVQS